MDGLWELKFLHLSKTARRSFRQFQAGIFCLSAERTYSIRVPREKFSAAVDSKLTLLIHSYGLLSSPGIGGGWGGGRRGLSSLGTYLLAPAIVGELSS